MSKKQSTVEEESKKHTSVGEGPMKNNTVGGGIREALLYCVGVVCKS
jgi:hypothetical protein